MGPSLSVAAPVGVQRRFRGLFLWDPHTHHMQVRDHHSSVGVPHGCGGPWGSACGGPPQAIWSLSATGSLSSRLSLASTQLRPGFRTSEGADRAVHDKRQDKRQELREEPSGSLRLGTRHSPACPSRVTGRHTQTLSGSGCDAPSQRPFTPASHPARLISANPHITRRVNRPAQPVRTPPHRFVAQLARRVQTPARERGSGSFPSDAV